MRNRRMRPSKWNLSLIFTILSISTSIESAKNKEIKRDERLRRYTSNQSHDVPSYFEHILREFTFKTISAPSSGNYDLYRNILNAPFFSGPIPIVSNDLSNVLLSRGEIYHLPGDHWMFCQEGCSDCRVCTEYTHPTLKWSLRRIKSVSERGPNRHDLQLTILPQIDGSYHMRSLWPRSYVYVTSQSEQNVYSNDRHSYRNDASAYSIVEQDVTQQTEKFENFWTYVDKGTLNERPVISKEQSADHNGSRIENISPRKKEEESTEGNQNDEKNIKRLRSKVKSFDKSESNGSLSDGKLRENGNFKARQSIPKLILGTDQSGQKHLIHVVPADTSINASLANSVVNNLLNTVAHNRTAYQRMLRKIYDSLSSNKRFIENFLDPLKHVNRKLKDENEEHDQEESKNGLVGLRKIHDYDTQKESSLKKPESKVFNWERQSRGSNGNSSIFGGQ